MHHRPHPHKVPRRRLVQHLRHWPPPLGGLPDKRSQPLCIHQPRQIPTADCHRVQRRPLPEQVVHAQLLQILCVLRECRAVDLRPEVDLSRGALGQGAVVQRARALDVKHPVHAMHEVRRVRRGARGREVVELPRRDKLADVAPADGRGAEGAHLGNGGSVGGREVPVVDLHRPSAVG